MNHYALDKSPPNFEIDINRSGRLIKSVNSAGTKLTALLLLNILENIKVNNSEISINYANL